VIFGAISPSNCLASCALALLLDLCFGDPSSFPHPVRGIGWLISRLETLLYRSKNRLISGCALLGLVVFITGLCAFLPLLVARRLGPYGQVAIAALLLWPAIAVRDLFDHADRVRKALKQGDLVVARSRLAAMVSRDTASLGETDIARGCVESVAENLVDGVLAPIFFALLGGPVLAYAFKAVSTLDSMVGYRNERYRQFGWASARADDVLNYIPARLLFVTLPLAAQMCGTNPWKCFLVMVRDGDKNPSPNSGIPEAGFAGALGVQLGGVNVYGGRQTVKPFINEAGRPAEIRDLRRAQILMLSASLTAFALLAWSFSMLAELPFWHRQILAIDLWRILTHG